MTLGNYKYETNNTNHPSIPEPFDAVRKSAQRTFDSNEQATAVGLTPTATETDLITTPSR